MPSGFEGSSDASRCWSSPTSSVSVEVKSSISSRNRVSAHGRANSNRCVTSWIAIQVRKSVGSRLHSFSKRAMFGTTNSSAPEPSGRGTAMSYCPSTCWASVPRTVPTCAPSSSGESCPSTCATPACDGSGIASCCAAAIASPIFAAAGSSTARSPSMFAWTHCPRRTASTFGMSEGASRPVNPATWSSATRTASSNPRRSPSPGAGSSVPQDADAIPTCLASSQFTGPLEDISTRWISRNSGTSFQTSPGGTPNGCSSGVGLMRSSYGRAGRTPGRGERPPGNAGLRSGPRRPGPSLRWVRATRPARARHGGPDRRRRGGRVRERPRGGRDLRLPGDRARPLGRRRA